MELAHTIFGILAKIYAIFGKWIMIFGYALGVFFFDYLYIPKDATLLLALLMAVDTVTGSMKVLRWKRNIYSSYEMMIGAGAKLGVLIMILAAAILAKIIFLLGSIDIGLVPILSISIAIFAIAQFFSTLQNVYIFLTGDQVNEVDAITKAVKILQGIARRMLESFITKR